jgi:hypothetical protein
MTTNYSFTFGATAGSFTAHSIVDSGSVVPEGNEANNRGSVSYNVWRSGVATLTFSGANFRNVLQDNGSGAYSTPHWDAGSVTGGTFSPACYIRNGTLTVSVGFTISSAGTTSGKLIGTASSGGTFSADVTIGAGGFSVADLPCSATISSTVDYFNPLTITWELSLDGGASYAPIGTTANRVYVTWSTPAQATPNETLLLTGCTAAKGVTGIVGTDDDKVLDAVWVKFQTRSIRRASDNVLLTYYGFFDVNGNGAWDAGIDTDLNDPFLCRITDAGGLIRTGNGQCHAWADFMNEVMKAQGLGSINGVANEDVGLVIKAAVGDLFAVKNWAKTGVSPRTVVSFDAGVDGSAAVAPNPANNEAADAAGAAGQGNSPNPPSNFVNHYIVKMNGKYYDPSYALGPFTDRKVYEDAAFAGSLRQVGMTWLLDDLPANDGNAANHADEINDYTEVAFP